MKVKILKSCISTGVKEGELYNASFYSFDESKVMLETRIPDGYEPECTEYRENLEVLTES